VPSDLIVYSPPAFGKAAGPGSGRSAAGSRDRWLIGRGVAAWFEGVAAARATLAALIAATAKQASHGWLRVLFIILVVIAGVSFIVLLLTGPRAACVIGQTMVHGRDPNNPL
jgi:hypothetical protein